MGASRIPQAAAIPVRDGLVCLVTSSSGRRWIVPKGMLEPEKSLADIAVQEAWEEAGVTGELATEPLGEFEYAKANRQFHVTVYLLNVTAEHARWPERRQRVRRWVSWDDALGMVTDEGLRRVLRHAAALYEPSVVGS